MMVSGLCIGVQFQSTSGGALDLVALTVDNTVITVDSITIGMDATIE